jgi:glyoxylate reductase
VRSARRWRGARRASGCGSQPGRAAAAASRAWSAPPRSRSCGGIVDERALCDALASGQLGAAALDVFAREPLPLDSPLHAAPNLVLAPHIGSATRETRARMAELCGRNLLAGLRGEAMPRCANP